MAGFDNGPVGCNFSVANGCVALSADKPSNIVELAKHNTYTTHGWVPEEIVYAAPPRKGGVP